MSLDLEVYLESLQIQDEVLQEIEPIMTSAIIGGAAVVLNIIYILIAVAQIKAQTKIDKKWTKRLNEILETNDWRVHKIPEKDPNAFSIGGKYVFITSGLEKMMNKREIEAIMLHEVYHSTAKHMPKKLAYETPFTFMVIFIATNVAFASAPLLGLLFYVLFKSVPNIAYAWIAGKRYEVKADEYAVKHGYKDELISALNKLEYEIKKRTAHQQCGFICKAVEKIDEAIDEHPPVRKRVEKILKKSKELNKLAKSKNIKGIKKFVMGVFKK